MFLPTLSKGDSSDTKMAIFVVRHGERADYVDRSWVANAERKWDPPLTGEMSATFPAPWSCACSKGPRTPILIGASTGQTKTVGAPTSFIA